MSPSARRILVCVLVCGVAVATGVQAQIPDKFTNLQVLPKDISKGELVAMMREFSGALGQRCKFCHVGEDPNSLEGYDFASDAPEHKKVARVMMQMVQEINGSLLPKIGHEPHHKVSCVTCHRGVPEPETIEAILREALEDGGADALGARYRELRERYYGKGTYDFSGAPLNDVAETLARQDNDLDTAIAITRLNLEFNGNEAPTHLLLGQLYMQKGDKEAAQRSVERALELEPDNKWAQRMLQRLKSN